MEAPQPVTKQGTLVPTTTSWKLAPSDFAFLWEECRRCFYLKVAREHKRPSMPFPSVFSQIDSGMKNFFMGRRTEEVCPELAPGTFAFFGKWVESRPFEAPGRATTCYVRGPFDTVVAFDDGSFAVIDFKTTTQKPENVAKYARQLHAYALALENAAPGKFALGPVSRLGLLCFDPKAFARDAAGRGVLSGGITWVEIPRDDGAFRAFLSEVLGVLEAPEPPTPGETCDWCQYRAAVRANEP